MEADRPPAEMSNEIREFTASLLAASDSAFRLARSLGRSPEDAADVFQEACARAWTHRDQVRGQWRPWFLTIVYRLASRRSGPGWLPLPRIFDAPSDSWPGSSLPDPTLGQALSLLAPRQRAALLLHYGKDMSIESTAQVLSASIPATKQLLARARGRLRHSYLNLEASNGI